jgi:carboxylesterase type B
MPAHQICEAFQLAGNASAELSKLYGIVKDRPAACRFGSLDLLNDAKFVLPVEAMTEAWRHAQRPVFRFLVDQPNPWQSSSRAHHAVDLLYVFGAFDLSFNPAAQQVTMEMQQKWIEFVNGRDPWQSDVYWTFGPHGESQSIDDLGFGSRRRKRHLDALKRCGSAELDAVTKALAAGRLSLLN